MSSKDINYVNVAKKILETELKGIQELINWVDNKYFVSAIKLLEKIKGRVITSGMGKSGYIAKKVAATMASTGTPALFVHPAEASHGDLGMITQNDAVIIFSNSGESTELKDLIEYCVRFSIPLIGIVRKSQSTLVQHANYALILPDTEEANNINAPTTSTTMMLALGDAISVCLLEKKSFNKDQFKIFHPGGKLGAALLKVSDLMHKEEQLPVLNISAKMSDVLLEMTSKGFGCVAITENNNLVGIITDGDLRRHMNNNLLQMNIIDIMTKKPITLQLDDLAGTALKIMEDNSITNLFVTDNKNKKKVIGIIHIHDCLRAGVA